MSDVKIYCEVCDTQKPMIIEMSEDKSFPDQGIWGDILCADCYFIIATVSGDEEGSYGIVLQHRSE